MKDKNKTKAQLITELEEMRVRVSECEQAESGPRQVEKALLDSAEIFSKAFHAHPVAMQIFDLDSGRGVDINESFMEITGNTREELVESNLYSIDLMEISNGLSFPIKTLEKVGIVSDYPMEFRTSSGEFKNLMVSASLLDLENKNWCVASYVDITMQLQMEQQILESRDKERLLLDNIPMQVWYLTDDHTYGVVNKVHSKFTGLRIKDMAFKNMYDIFPNEVVELWHANNKEVFKTGKTDKSQIWITDASGEQRLISIVKSPRLDSNGKVDFVVCSAEDITQRYFAEIELEKSQALIKYAKQQQSLALRAAKACTWEWRVGDEYEIWSEEAYHIFGLPKGDGKVKHADWRSIVHPSDLERVSYDVSKTSSKNG
ncbi:MAG: PAS domain S-box protein, partial [Anaerolineae bacterium]|nr:PAS domain S-box protein [Anaerolineae bacterium]